VRVGFAIGKCGKKTRNVVLLKVLRAPIQGPFTLKAVVTR
jgi:hypothetical protein